MNQMSLYLAVIVTALFSCTPPPGGVVKDTLLQESPTPGVKHSDAVAVYSTSEITGDRLEPSSDILFQPATQPLETEIAVFVNPAKAFQSYLGIGGAITDASAEVFFSLSEDKQQEFRCLFL